MKYIIPILFLFISTFSAAQTTSRAYLDEMDVSTIDNGWSYTRVNTNFRNGPIKLSGKFYKRGICVHAYAIAFLKLNKGSEKFHSVVGIEDTMALLKGNSVEIFAIADGKKILDLGIINPGDPSKNVDLDVKGVDILELHVKGVNGTHHAHVSWADAWFEVKGSKPFLFKRTPEPAVILTPKPSLKPRINGARILGCRPGSPILYKIPASGQKPIAFAAKNLPLTLRLDPKSGIISGALPEAGMYKITLMASNELGSAEKEFTISCGEQLALTPPLGWNSWNCWGMSVDAEKVKKAAEFMVSSGLADHGWSYINIDDGWQGESRDTITGEIQSDKTKFPNMRQLSDFVHSKGLKLGIYSSPGRFTCGKKLGSLQHEEKDASTYSKWGIDYLKHDWCSYGDIYKKPSNYEAQLPYRIMNEALKKQPRDIVFSLCQYGWNEVWKWGKQVGGSCWRTTGDIIDNWPSMIEIGFHQNHNAAYAGPGAWNDPDMLVVGKVGWSTNLHPTRLTPNEQYTHISLWSLLAAPLLLGCDLSDLDEFTLNLLTNDEVLEINQDALGKQATEVLKNESILVYKKELEDGSLAVGIFNTHQADLPFTLAFDKIGLKGKFRVRDVWRQKDLKASASSFTTQVPLHGVVLLKLSQVKK